MTIGTRGRSKKTYRTKKTTQKKLVKAIKRVVNYRTEKKFYDTIQNGVVFNATGLTAGGICQPLSGMGTGGTVSLRIGDRIICKRLDISFNVDAPLAGGGFTGDTSCRLIIFAWNDNDGTPPIPAAVLQYINFGYTPSSPYLNESLQGRRLKVFYDSRQRVTLNSTNGNLIIQKRINLKDHYIQYNQAVATGNNNLYMLVVSDNTTASGFVWSLYGTVRLWFTDA